MRWQAECRASQVEGVKFYLYRDSGPAGVGRDFWELRLLLQPLWDTAEGGTALFHKWFKRQEPDLLTELELWGFRRNMSDAQCGRQRH